MSSSIATPAAVPRLREIPHTVSPGLWALAWKRLKSDRVGMVSLAIVAVFVAMMLASGLGLVAADWAKETGVNYAPPSFVGADSVDAMAPTAASTSTAKDPRLAEFKPTIVDPLGDVLAEIRGERKSADAGATAGASAEGEVVDPLADVMKEIATQKSGASAPGTSVDPLAGVMADIRKDAKGAAAPTTAVRAATLPLGGDKWGRDVLKKTIKGSETSIFVGLAAAAVATFLGTLFGAIAGYHGRRVDDFFNWFYSVFNSIPYLLLILAVAAVLQQKGMLTIILILGLTGWTGIFRLVRGEYLKHKAREYVQAADAIGASHVRRMFVHIFPNISHVVLVQMSIYVVAFIKAEVILSFLGFGVPVDVVSS
jgi:peptide/nickel transport system permease protein